MKRPVEKRLNDSFNVLILGMGGDVSKGIWKAIKKSEIPCRIIGACISLSSEGLYLCDTAYVAPLAADDAFIPWLIDICNREKIDIVFTGVEENVLAISKAISELQEKTTAVFRVCTPEQLEIGGDKYKTCLWLEDHGFPTPGYALADDEESCRRLGDKVGYPLVVKPRGGKGSQGVFLISEETELWRLSGLEGYVVEEYVGTSDQEYTVGCYYGLHGELPDPIIMRRELKNGASWKTEVVENERIREQALEICKAFKPNGPLNIQLRLRPNGLPVPFELNVRFSGTTPIRAHFGFCDVKAMIYESLENRDISSCFSINKGVAYRYVEEIYLSSVPSCGADGKISWSARD